MTRHRHALAALAALACAIPSTASARSNYVSRIPNGSANSCLTCHVTSGGGGACGSRPCLNDFGGAFRTNGLAWSAGLAGGDADADGWSNGHELLDPFGQWSVGQASPGVAADATLPGDGAQAPTRDLCVAAEDNDCDPSATCADADATSGDFSCACPAGFDGSGHTLVDTTMNAVSAPYTLNAAPVAGCASPCDDANVCRQDLGNSCAPGANGVTCGCVGGYFDDGTTCVDVDECADPTTCGEDLGNGTCSNNDGGYSCSCGFGYQPGGSGQALTCVDTDECALGACGATGVDTCSNTPGGYDCTCAQGFEPTGMAIDLSLQCSDVDECAEPDACGQDLDAGNLCANNPGGYDCSCAAGYTDDGTTCVDVDECASDPCGANSTSCSNEDGGYTCACAAGFAFDGTTCVVENPCTRGLDNCSDDAICAPADNASGFTCACAPGFTGDGVTCLDVNECDGENACGAELGGNTCANTPGGYTCACADGFTFEGQGLTLTCVDVDECLDDPCGENSSSCNNTDGGFFCACDDGYAAPDGLTDCVDVDECAAGTDDCADGEECINQPGAFSCEATDPDADAGGDPDAGGEVDAGGQPDAGGQADAGGPDDGGVDGGVEGDADCACSSASTPSPTPLGFVIALLALVGWRRRD